MSGDSRANILIVDDMPERLLALRAVLEELDQNLVTASSGREALRCLLRMDFAVVLLDVNMPDLDGFATAALIRRRQRSEQTPIIFVTAYSDEAYACQGYSLGAVDYILTPVVPEVLRAKVRVFVDLYQKNEQLQLQAQEHANLAAVADVRASQLRTLAAQLVTAEQRERSRLAQLLHDHVQQLLVAARMGIDRARLQASLHAMHDDLESIAELIDQSILASRSLATELYPPVLNEAGLSAALEWLGRWMFEKYGLRVDVRGDSAAATGSLGEDVRILTYQAVRELLFNVVKHSGTRTASVELGLAGPQVLRLVVADHGVGFHVPPADRQVGHPGLGLFGVRERIESMGGQIEVESAPGAGTKVRLMVPAEAPAAAEPHGEAGEEPLRTAARRQPQLCREGSQACRPLGDAVRVLLADDHTILRKGLRTLLEGEPDMIVVGEAADGSEALAQAHQLAPDVVVMDISMPGMNGIEATRRIKQELPSTIVIGLSFHEDQEIIASLLDVGAASYFTKGGPPEKLLEAIRGGCGNRSGTAAQTLGATP